MHRYRRQPEEGDRGGVKSTRWATPQDVFDALDEEFNFVCDMAAEPDTAKCPVFITEEIDALAQDWLDWAEPGQAVFINPPYGSPRKPKNDRPGNPGVAAFLYKCWVESRKGITVVALLHAKTDTQWWTDWCERAESRWFYEGRIPFINPDTGKPGPGGPSVGQAVIVFDPNWEGPSERRVDRQLREVKPRPLNEAGRGWWPH